MSGTAAVRVNARVCVCAFLSSLVKGVSKEKQEKNVQVHYGDAGHVAPDAPRSFDRKKGVESWRGWWPGAGEGRRALGKAAPLQGSWTFRLNLKINSFVFVYSCSNYAALGKGGRGWVRRG